MSEITLSWVALALYGVTFAVWLAAFLGRRRGDSRLGFALLLLALLVHLGAVIWRGAIAGHLPFASRFEALLFYALVTALLAGIIGWLRRDVPVAFLVMPIVIVFLLGALLGGEKTPRPLMPVLNSPFFAVHVVIAFLGYGFYSVNAGLAVAALMAGDGRKPMADSSVRRLPDSDVLLGLARQLVPWGLLLLGSGIGLGAVWAQYSWGNWWGWDPKENAALVTWLAYAVYLHAPFRARATASARRWEAVILLASYLLLIGAFLGVNLLRRGLHAYQ
jgi:cytochrome c-type biogenesis protein CcsB